MAVLLKDVRPHVLRQLKSAESNKKCSHCGNIYRPVLDRCPRCGKRGRSA